MIKQNIIIDSEQLEPAEHDKLGERFLWQAVIIKALEDLELPRSNKRYRTWQKQAVQWFNQNDEEFLLVCEYANLSPYYVLELAKKTITKQNQQCLRSKK